MRFVAVLTTAVLALQAGAAAAQSYSTGVSEWSGPHAGIQLGRFGYTAEGEIGNFDTSDTIEQGYFGAHAGFLAPVYPFVLGGEVSVDVFRIGEVEYRDIQNGRTSNTGTLDVDDWGNLIRLKAIGGYDAGRVMPYLTAGLSRLTIGDEATGGYFVGIGGAMNVTPKISISLEGIYDSFDAPTLCGDGCLDYEDGATGRSVMLKGSYRF